MPCETKAMSLLAKGNVGLILRHEIHKDLHLSNNVQPKKQFSHEEKNVTPRWALRPKSLHLRSAGNKLGSHEYQHLQCKKRQFAYEIENEYVILRTKPFTT